ncbi:MAG: hypothetical protein F6J93_20705 [Oscillatoria sp. SIO1A7]|nr:hypothetical protein [Oscillatoria sp. SIO1A7]
MGTGGHGDWGTGGLGDSETWGLGDMGTWGDSETWEPARFLASCCQKLAKKARQQELKAES